MGYPLVHMKNGVNGVLVEVHRPSRHGAPSGFSASDDYAFVDFDRLVEFLRTEFWEIDPNSYYEEEE